MTTKHSTDSKTRITSTLTGRESVPVARSGPFYSSCPRLWRREPETPLGSEQLYNCQMRWMLPGLRPEYSDYRRIGCTLRHGGGRRLYRFQRRLPQLLLLPVARADRIALSATREVAGCGLFGRLVPRCDERVGVPRLRNRAERCGSRAPALRGQDCHRLVRRLSTARGLFRCDRLAGCIRSFSRSASRIGKVPAHVEARRPHRN